MQSSDPKKSDIHTKLIIRSAIDRTNPMLLIAAFEKYEHYKVKQKGDVTQATWNREYGGRPNINIYRPNRILKMYEEYLT